MSRPWWQQEALARLARGDVYSDVDIEHLAEAILAQPPEEPDGGWLGSLTGDQQTIDDPVTLVAIRDVQNVNRLAPAQTLTFAEQGLTVVFGPNGSGKSGYARIIQSMVRTRTKAAILPDVFGAPCQSSGVLEYRVGSDLRTHSLDAEPPVDLSRAAFYDETTGDDYLSHDSEVLYRPALLRVLDELATTCDRVRAVISAKRDDSDALATAMPQVAPYSSHAQFLANLSESTPDAAIEAQCKAPDNAEGQLQRLRTEEAKLHATDPNAEKQRLRNLASALTHVVDHLSQVAAQLDATKGQQVLEARDAAEATQQAAELAAQTGFKHDPLPLVGKAAWRQLWDSASRYSYEAHQDHIFPHTEADAVCVLCQQKLSSDGRDRMERFARFVADDTATKARAARTSLEGIEATLRSLQTNPATIVQQVALISAGSEQCADDIKVALDALEQRCNALLTPSPELAAPVDVSPLVARLKQRATELVEQANRISAEAFNERLQAIGPEQRALADSLLMQASRQAIVTERNRLRQRSKLSAAFNSANTRPISEKIAGWTERFVTEASTDWFTRESDRLGLERVTLRNGPARKGVVHQRPGLIGATMNAKLPQVLSEGEQTALGLAGFLTEAHFDPSKSALIFDDPVTSLDHVRRGKVADRIVSYAKGRQVIVFTHDTSFSADLRVACNHHAVAFTERSVSRSMGRQPGLVFECHPWSAKTAAQRLDHLRQSTAQLRKRTELSEEDYAKEAKSIAGDMSETWERIVSQEIAEKLVDHKTLNVQPKMMRVLTKVNDRDDKEFQESYYRISGWAGRHDKHPDRNWTPPSLEELNQEIELIDQWFRRVKKYDHM